MRKRFLLLLSCAALLAGCGSSLPFEAQDDDGGAVQVSQYLTVENTNPDLVLTDNKDVLAADGLYYATWCCGEPESYTNSDGETADLYDAELYLLLCESAQSAEAQENMAAWLAAEKENYAVDSEAELACGDQDYTVIAYHSENADNPYARDVSAFTVFENNAVCAELTCRETFGGDLMKMLTDFLECCEYHSGS